MRLTRIAALCFLLLCAGRSASALPVRVLATGDMHGWLEAQEVDNQRLGGAAEMLAYWKRMEGYSPSRFLVLSCGDIATGPTLSTLFEGDPVIEVMNRMGYDASVLGNHEFDFGLESLRKWRERSIFPFLAANLFEQDGVQSDAVVPYLLYDEQGVKVGIIGLTVENVEAITDTAGLVSGPYEESLRRWVPQLRGLGAEAVLVVTHVPMEELIELAEAVGDLGVPLMLGGHSHEFGQIKVKDTWVVNSGEWWDGYSRIDLDYDPETGKTVVLTAKQVWLQQAAPESDEAVAREIDRWRALLPQKVQEPIGYTATGLQRPVAAYNFVVDCWLAMDGKAEIALTNHGSLRQDIPPGSITRATITGLMPFSNSLLRITLSGSQLLEYLPEDGAIGMAGLSLRGGECIMAGTGRPVEPQMTYRVLINDYMYETCPALQAADPKPEEVYTDWRQPVYEWLLLHPSSEGDPLENLVDVKPRVVP